MEVYWMLSPDGGGEGEEHALLRPTGATCSMAVQREGENARGGTLSPVLDVAVVVQEISLCLSPSLLLASADAASVALRSYSRALAVLDMRRPCAPPSSGNARAWWGYAIRRVRGELAEQEGQEGRTPRVAWRAVSSARRRAAREYPTALRDLLLRSEAGGGGGSGGGNPDLLRVSPTALPPYMGPLYHINPTLTPSPKS